MLVKNANYFWIPAYLVGIVTAAASLNLLPTGPGVVLASILAVAMLTPPSLWHSACDSIEVHLCIYGLVLCGAILFAGLCIPDWLGPTAFVLAEGGTPVTWYQILFVTVQQVFYFGIHAFTSDD
ncbi:MAG: hypothetical protein SFV17_04470 [Candidatus Obscuribacter sp.]|nr:hypothetical protein [Candidatus Obscuribacter sp.]